MPRTTEIPRTDWSQALDRFSTVHENWLVSLDILSPDMGAQPEVIDLPLVGVTFEAANDGEIIITAARSAADHITHVVQRPTHIWIERTDTGADAALQVESADGTKTILQMKTAVLPETVDPVAQ